MIRFIQVNLNHCRSAHDLLMHTEKNLKIGISIIAEPYQIPDDCTWVGSTNGKAAIHWSREHLLNAGIKRRIGEHSVTVQWPSFCVTACYISPNCSNEEYDELIDELDEATNDNEISHIIGGDFNCKAHLWGSKDTDYRGELLIRWAASKGMNLLNKGKEPTCVRSQGVSVVDLTWASDRLYSKVQDWHVMDECTLSDHMYISFKLNKSTSKNNIVKKKYIKWAIKKLDEDMYNEVMEWLCTGEVNLNKENAANWLSDIITDACEAAMPRAKPHHRNSVYWWSENIAQVRRNCNKERRKWQKSKRKRKSIEDIILLEDRYRETKKELTHMIKKAKIKAWEELIRDLNQDPWGLPYRLVLNKLRRSEPVLTEILDGRVLQDTISNLFPYDPDWKEGTGGAQGIWNENDSIDKEEICNILRKAKINKAPGMDGIKAILLKKIPAIMLKKMTDVFNIYLEAGVFPDIWKKAILVLIPKGTLDIRAPKVRPICLLSEIGKVFEKVIVRRINTWMDSHPEARLSPRQYGFRRKTSTCDALSQVRDFITEATNEGEITIGISLDIKNAFNSIRWKRIREALIRKGFPYYICKIIDSYLDNRYIEYPINDGNTETRQMTAGVPQGSVLGPVLWNITYDWVLETPLERNCTVIGYADDTIILTRSETTEEALCIAKLQLSKILKRIKKLGLSLSEKKTAIVAFYKKRQDQRIQKVRIGQEEIPITGSMKYLGIFLDHRWKFDVHIEYLEKKAQKIINALSRIMPNLRGPCEAKRRLYAHTIASVINYGAAIWSGALTDRKLNAKLRKIQRITAIRVIAAYKTTSADAALLLARIPPAALHAEYFRRVYSRIQDLKSQEDWTIRDEEDIKNEERILLYRQWQLYAQREETAGKRTRDAIMPNFQEWIGRDHGYLTYRITQLLTGHGCFYSFLSRIGKAGTPLCPFCELESDTAEHTIQTCPEWTNERKKLTDEIGLDLRLGKIVEKICESKENWEAFHLFAEEVLLRKEEDERERERATRVLLSPQ